MDPPHPVGVNDSASTESLSSIGVRPTHAPGELLAGRFRIIRYLARGGMGEVYEAADLQLQGQRLALKTLLPKISKDPGGVSDLSAKC